jgi:phospholipase/carboxylesterase
VRAPIAEGGGFAWFANRGVGRPLAESLQSTMAWFTRWLDEVAASGRPVFLVGFSGGAAFAGGLVLADPSRYAGAAILYGTLPFDAGIPVDTGQLANLPMFVAQGDADHVIPRELLDRTWAYLLDESGAPTVARRDPSGHVITAATLRRLSDWVADRVDFLAAHEPAPVGIRGDVVWPSLPDGVLPHRTGSRPQVSWSIPQQQKSQSAPGELQEQLFERIRDLPGVSTSESHISVPGARAFVVADRSGPEGAFLVPQVGEFAHLHPEYDGSLHLALPAPLAADLVAQGWGSPHPWAGTRLAPGFVMLFGPRNTDELETVVAIVTVAHAMVTSAAS